MCLCTPSHDWHTHVDKYAHTGRRTQSQAQAPDGKLASASGVQGRVEGDISSAVRLSSFEALMSCNVFTELSYINLRGGHT